MSKTYRELSKFNYVPNEPHTTKDIEIGCLQRIADAMELTAKNYLEIQKQLEEKKKDAERFYQWYQDGIEKNNALKRSIIAHKSNYTRLKNKLEAMKENETN